MSEVNTIGLIRHGVTEWNLLGKIQGTTDTPLSEEGKRQASLLADRLKVDELRWDGVIASDLQRAATTGRIIAQRLGIPLLVDERLRERSFGQAEGTTLPERIERWGEEWRKQVPDQEPDDAIIARGAAFIEAHMAEHPGERWLVVTHGSFLATLLRHLCDTVDDKHIQNVSLTIVEHRTDTGWTSVLHNCTRHLQQV